MKIVMLSWVVLIATAAFFQYTMAPHSDPDIWRSAQVSRALSEWVYLSTGFDMSYVPARQMDHHMFDNVFVNPEAYKAFEATGTWPDKTMLVLEVRGARAKVRLTKKAIIRVRR